jgi:hypothetical protein
MTGNKGHVGAIPQDRDRRIFSELAHLIDITSEMAVVIAPFTSLNKANIRLLELVRAGFLKRYFVGTINGGRMAIYRLAAKGAVLIGVPVRFSERKIREHIAKDLFLDHRLRVNSIFILLKYRPIPFPGVRLVRWLSFSETLSKSTGLIPDGYFELEAGGIIRPMFVEVDLGTEPLQVWMRKTQRYLEFAASGEFSKHFKQAQFRVLVITDSERRLETIRTTVARSIDRIFWFATFDSINRDSFWSPIWLRPKGDQKHEKVEVTGEAAQVDTSSSAMGGFVNSVTIRELPLNGR